MEVHKSEDHLDNPVSQSHLRVNEFDDIEQYQFLIDEAKARE